MALVCPVLQNNVMRHGPRVHALSSNRPPCPVTRTPSPSIHRPLFIALYALSSALPVRTLHCSTYALENASLAGVHACGRCFFCSPKVMLK